MLRRGLGLCAALAMPLALVADDLAARTVVLVNARQPGSMALGRDYAEQRGIPLENLVALPMPEEETIRWRDFVDQVWQPLQDELVSRGWIDGFFAPRGERDAVGRRKVKIRSHRLAYLVVCRGTPLRIESDPALPVPASAARGGATPTNQGAVDSELTLLAVGGYDPAGWLPNPWFNTVHPPAAAQAVVKVSRLDGPTWDDARGLVRSALAGERDGLRHGRYYVDIGGPFPEGDRWLEETVHELKRLGLTGDVERSPATYGDDARIEDAVFYFGWYAGAINGPFVRPGFHFAPGAIALHIHSFSAETLHAPAKGWCGPLVARGVAATFGNVYEPYLPLSERPDLLVAALARGDTLGDAAYAAMPALSWQAIVIGDPLYRPLAPQHVKSHSDTTNPKA